MLGGLGDVEVVVEEATVKDLVNLLWDELAVAPLMCSVGGVSWAYLWEAFQALVYVLDKDPICERKFIVLCLGCVCS